MNVHHKTSQPIRYGDFGTVVTPLTNHQIEVEAAKLLQDSKARQRMRQAAVSGINSAETHSLLREVRLDLTERALRAAQQADGPIAALARELGRLKIEPLIPESIHLNAETETARDIRQPLAGVIPSEAAHQERLRYRNSFRAERGIRRDALHPNGQLTAITIGSMVLIEAAMVMALFNDASNHWSEVMVMGVLAALTTAGLGLGLGFTLRHVLHGRPPETVLEKATRFAAHAGAVGLGLTLATLNLGFGHYRDKLAAAAQGAEFELIAPDFSIVARPWEWLSFDTTQGILLTLLGLGLAAFGAWKGYRGFSDPVPGYTKVDRAYRDAANTALRQQEQLREAVGDAIDREEAALGARMAMDLQTVERARELVDQAALIAEQYAATKDNLVGIGNVFVKHASEAYQEVRPDLPDYLGPSAFYHADDFPALKTDLAKLEAKALALQEAHATNMANVPVTRQGLMKLRQRFMSMVERMLAKLAGHDLADATRAAHSTLQGDL